MAKKQRDEGGGSGEWLNTYADLVTLLLTFFIMLFSMSTLQQEAFDQLVEGLKGPPGTESSVDSPSDSNEPQEPVDLEDVQVESLEGLYEYLSAYIEANNMQDRVEVNQSDDMVFIRFNRSVFFASDSYQLKKDSIPMLDFMGECFSQISDKISMINIYGHSAEVNDPNYPVNALMLSSERAANVAIYFDDECGIDPKILNAIGQGNAFPIADNNTAEGREKNRRVDMIIVGKDAYFTGGAEDIEKLFQGTYDENIYPKPGGAEDLLTPDGNPAGGEDAPPPSADGTADGAEQDVQPENNPNE